MLTGHLAALFTITVWGITFISTKIILAEVTAEEILFIRFVLGWIALWALSHSWLGWQGKRIEATFAAAGFFGVTLYFLLENIALEYTYASNVAVIVCASPFFTALADWLFFDGEKPGLRFYAGFVIAMTGICLICFKSGDIHISPTGDILALLAGIAWAFYSGFTKKLAALNLGSLVTTRRIFFYGLVLMLPVVWFSGFNAGPHILTEPVILWNLLFLGLLASALCFASWTFCVGRLGAAQTSAYIYLVPVVTVIAAAIWLKEIPGPAMILGMMLVIAGLILSETKFRPRRPVTALHN